MSIVCPTVTPQSKDLHEYRMQMERVEFAPRIQVDLTDGEFAPTNTPEIDEIWFPENTTIDLHLMYVNPADVLNTVLDLKPNLLIVHAEAKVHIPTLAVALKQEDIRFGLALLPQTQPQDILDYMEYLDHVLIFSGDLGHFGGVADLSLLTKVAALKSYKSDLEFGWDGGANKDNIKILRDGGIDVINVGGSIQKSDNPKSSYDELVNLLQS